MLTATWRTCVMPPSFRSASCDLRCSSGCQQGCKMLGSGLRAVRKLPRSCHAPPVADAAAGTGSGHVFGGWLGIWWSWARRLHREHKGDQGPPAGQQFLDRFHGVQPRYCAGVPCLDPAGRTCGGRAALTCVGKWSLLESSGAFSVLHAVLSKEGRSLRTFPKSSSG